MTRYRLVVYPPGIDESERRRVRVWRGWPMWGALVWIVAEIWLSDMTGPWPAAALSTATFLGSGAAAAALAGNARRSVRTMTVMAMAGYYDPLSAAARNKLEELANSLLEADDRLDHGQISAIDYELAWWRVYDQMVPDSAAWPGIHWSARSA